MQKVTNKQCGVQAGEPPMILYPRGQPPPDLGSEYKYIATPLRKVALTRSVHSTFLEMLGVRDRIVVASEYTSSACIAKMVVDGNSEAFVSHRTNLTQHQALMAHSEIDGIVTDAWNTEPWHHAPSKSKTICASLESEETPLRTAEWIKVCAARHSPAPH